MEVIYWCYAGAHTSVIAAAIHLGLLPQNLNITDILSLPNFDATRTVQLGIIYKYGTDQFGNNIYVASLGPNRSVSLPLLQQLLSESGFNKNSYLLVNALSCIKIETRIGGFLSRQVGLVNLGRTLCAVGILRSIKCFYKLVDEVKAACTNNP